jgi:hypothetical protein
VNDTLGPSEKPRAGGPTPTLRRTRFRLGALVAVAVVAGAVIWLAVGGNNSSTTAENTSAVAISPGGLQTLAGALRQPIYWVGPQTNRSYELIRRGNGQILLGYLPPGQKVGENKPHLMIGTYPITNAYATTQVAASKPDTVKIGVGGGAAAFFNKKYPLSAFVSYPGSSYQIEVYDPAPGKARKLVAAGKVKAVPGSPAEATRAVAVSAKQLAKRAGEEHQPIYWAGPVRRDTLELTRTNERWFFVRYLPPGVEVGSAKAYLTIGTYPVRDAFAAVQRLTQEKGAEPINLAGGGLAVVNPKHFPHSILLAYPGSDYQVEVFDSSLAHARRLVAADRIAAAG